MKSYFRDLFSSTELALRALAVALAGAFTAGLWQYGQRIIPPLFLLLLFLLGVMCDAIGRKRLPWKPVEAVRWMEWGIIGYYALAVLASAAAVVVAIKLVQPEGASETNKALAGTVSAAVVAFLSGSLVTWAGDQKDSRHANHIRSRFHEMYGYWPIPPKQNTPGALYVTTDAQHQKLMNLVHSDEYLGLKGWSREGRRKRAELIQEELKSLGLI